MDGVTENYSKFKVCEVLLQAEEASQSKIHGRWVSVYGQNDFRWKEVSVWNDKCKDGQTALNDEPEKHRGRPRALHNDENCVTVKSFIREDLQY
jgi:hypothetical protein